MDIFAGSFTTKGNFRGKNQDSVICAVDRSGGHNFGIACICDGIGRFQNSEVSAGMVTERVNEWFSGMVQLVKDREMSVEEVLADLDDTVCEINSVIWEKRRDEQLELGCTMSLVLLYDSAFYVFHVGDSKIFHMRDVIIQLTRDEVVMTESEGRTKAKLANFIGKSERLWANRTTGTLKEQDRFILGSDGLFNFLNLNDYYNEISEVKASEETGKLCEKLVGQALDAGSRDNVSCIILGTCQKPSGLFRRLSEIRH